MIESLSNFLVALEIFDKSLSRLVIELISHCYRLDRLNRYFVYEYELSRPKDEDPRESGRSTSTI